MSYFKKIPFGDVFKSFSEPFRSDTGMAIPINTSDVYEGQLLPVSAVPVSNLKGQFKRAVHKGDILFSEIRPSNRRYALITEENYLHVASTKLMVLRRISQQVDPLFAYKWLTSRSVLARLQHLAESRSGTFPQITFDVLSREYIPVPPLPEQRGIAATLGALDDKIESNQRTVHLAQDLGDALFEEVDGNHVKLDDIAEIVMGTSPKGEFLNETGNGLPFYQGTRDFGFRFPALRVWTTDPKRQASVNDTLLSVRAPVGDLNRASQTCCIGRGIAAIRSVDFPSILYYSMRGSVKIWEKFNGEGTVFGSVTKADVHEALIKWPKRDNLALLEKQLSIIDRRIVSLDQETKHLIVLRDTLLPELMSGRIRVAEAKMSVCEAIDADLDAPRERL